MPSNPAASLVAWSQTNPDAADADFPTRSQVSRRKSLQRVRHHENTIEEREVTKDWEFQILAEDLGQGIICISMGFYSMDICLLFLCCAAVP